ncbi:unnamed protein product [Sphagnum balticum]
MRKLMAQLMEALMIQGLGLNPKFVREYAECQVGLRLNFSKPCPEPAKHVGAPRHTDDTLMTILHQAYILSKQLYKSAMHLAVVNKSKTWLTVATGLFPAGSLVVMPAPELIDDERPPL